MTRCPRFSPVVVVALILSVGVAAAAPMVFAMEFARTGTVPTAGLFTFDPTTTTFSDFHIVWDGVGFDLSAAANTPEIFDFNGCPGGQTGSAAVFSMLKKSLPGCDIYQWGGLSLGDGGRFFSLLSSGSQVTGHVRVSLFDPSGRPGPFGFSSGSWTLSALERCPFRRRSSS